MCQILIPAANSHAHDRRVLAADGDRRICAHLRVHRNARYMIFTALLDHHGDWEFSTHGGLVHNRTNSYTAHRSGIDMLVHRAGFIARFAACREPNPLIC